MRAAQPDGTTPDAWATVLTLAALRSRLRGEQGVWSGWVVRMRLMHRLTPKLVADGQDGRTRAKLVTTWSIADGKQSACCRECCSWMAAVACVAAADEHWTDGQHDEHLHHLLFVGARQSMDPVALADGPLSSPGIAIMTAMKLVWSKPAR